MTTLTKKVVFFCFNYIFIINVAKMVNLTKKPKTFKEKLIWVRDYGILFLCILLILTTVQQCAIYNEVKENRKFILRNEEHLKTIEDSLDIIKDRQSPDMLKKRIEELIEHPN